MSIDSHLIEPRKYLLGHVGSTALSGTDGEVFQYNGQSFELVFDCKINVLLKGKFRMSEFEIPLLTILAIHCRCKSPQGVQPRDYRPR